MTWIDAVIIGIFLFFIVVGARMGSLWTGACIIGGFFGAALVDVYTLPVSSLMGGFAGSTVLAAIALYAGGVAAILIPGAVLSKIGSAFILNLIDGAFGLVTGAFAALILVSVVLLSAGPLIPKFESNRAFRNSKIARPLRSTLDEALGHVPYRSSFTRKKIEAEAANQLSDLTKNVEDSVKKLTP